MAVTKREGTPQLEPEHALLGGYQPIPGHWDELVDEHGAVRSHWRSLLTDHRVHRSPQQADELCRRLLREYGVTYNQAGTGRLEQRPWQLDSWPVVISSDEWDLLSRGVAQRARLLNQILADLYGPRQLLKSATIPPEIVLANPAYLRPATSVAPPHGCYLSHYAVDLARAPNGRWWVLGDRTDAPMGLGYALENRIVLGRVYPELIQDLYVQRIARFFASLRDRLLSLAAMQAREPRVVILTPGPFHATHFEQLYLARYLGFSLVEAEDLTVRDQGVFLKTLSGLLPVHVIVRYVRSDYCDPLELRDDSLLGVAGILQAARTGQVVLANAIGTGVLETPALQPFLPGLCRQILGQELLLPPVATWWCGDVTARDFVQKNIDQIVIRHVFGDRQRPYLPGTHDPAETLARVQANPHLYVGQEYVWLSTAPAWQNQELNAQHMVLRLFAAATADGEYSVMPGGLARAGDSPESVLLVPEAEGGSKDVWVLGDSPPDSTTLLPTSGKVSSLSRSGFVLPSRLADNLFWLGRYLERIEYGCRLTRCLLQRLTDDTDQLELQGAAFLLDVWREIGRIPADMDLGNGPLTVPQFQMLLHCATFAEDNPNSLLADLGRVERISAAVRDRLSHDAWRAIRALKETAFRSLPARETSNTSQLAVVDDLLQILFSLTGLTMDGMTRDDGWRFLEIGRRLERAACLCDVIRHALVDSDEEEALRLPVLLEIANSVMTYRSRYVFGPDPAAVLDLLLADESNPRSVAFQLATLYQHTRSLGTKHSTRPRQSQEQRLVEGVFSKVRLLDVDALASLKRGQQRLRLGVLLRRIRRAMEDLSRTLTQSYLTHARPVRALGRSAK